MLLSKTPGCMPQAFVMTVLLCLPLMCLAMPMANAATPESPEGSALYWRTAEDAIGIDELISDSDYLLRFTLPESTPHVVAGFDHWFYYKPDIAADAGAGPQYLQIRFPSIDSAHAYVVLASGEYVAYEFGDDIEFLRWPMATRLPTLPLTHKTQQATAVFFKLEATGQPAVMPLNVVSQTQLQREEQFVFMWYGVFFGASIALIFYNLALYITTQLPSYLWYVLYFSSFVLLQASISGIGQQFLWPDVPAFTTLFALVLVALTNGLMALFVSSFLELGRYARRLQTLLWLLAAGSFALALPLMFFDYIVVQNVQHAFAMLSMVLIYIIALYRLKFGWRPTIYLLVAYSLLFLGIAMALLRFNGLLPSTLFSEHLLEAAVLVEALILSMGLADRINLLQRQNEVIRLQAIDARGDFTRRLIAAHESEKSHFGAILHDDIGHAVLCVQYKIDQLLTASPEPVYIPEAQAQAQAPVHDQQLRAIRDDVKQVLSDLRNLARESHPHLLTQLGLESALCNLLDRALLETNIEYSCRCQPASLGVAIDQQLYRIAQECVSNTLKHASASEVVVLVEQSGTRFRFVYKDDGIGFDSRTATEGDHFGLVSIRERCRLMDAVARIDSTPGFGFCLNIEGHQRHE